MAGEIPEALGDVRAAVAAAGDHLKSAVLDIGEGAVGEQVPQPRTKTEAKFNCAS